jgi:hypothetical protein
MTSVVEKNSVVASATALDTAAKAALQHVLAARTELEKAREAALVVKGIADDQNVHLPRIGTVVSIRNAVDDLLDHIGLEVGDQCDVAVCQEASEEVAALVALVVNDIHERGVRT